MLDTQLHYNNAERIATDHLRVSANESETNSLLRRQEKPSRVFYNITRDGLAEPNLFRFSVFGLDNVQPPTLGEVLEGKPYESRYDVRDKLEIQAFQKQQENRLQQAAALRATLPSEPDKFTTIYGNEAVLGLHSRDRARVNAVDAANRAINGSIDPLRGTKDSIQRLNAIKNFNPDVFTF